MEYDVDSFLNEARQEQQKRIEESKQVQQPSENIPEKAPEKVPEKVAADSSVSQTVKPAERPVKQGEPAKVTPSADQRHPVQTGSSRPAQGNTRAAPSNDGRPPARPAPQGEKPRTGTSQAAPQAPKAPQAVSQAPPKPQPKEAPVQAKPEEEKPSVDNRLEKQIESDDDGKERQTGSSSAQAKPVKERSGSLTSDLKGIPTSLINMAKRAISPSMNITNKDAVCAFLYAFRDAEFDADIDYSMVSENVIRLSKQIEKNKVFENMDRTLLNIRGLIRDLYMETLKTEICAEYMTIALVGLDSDRRRGIADPKEIVFNTDTLDRLNDKLTKDTEAILKENSHKEGRPIR
ncbi:MAG: hypothetical protein IJS80_02725 [Lachnospiraceae bacterium]|nr:hypothetical protein [Lachnospiraceae bacterium]